jgi:hypothetical protein
MLKNILEKVGFRKQGITVKHFEMGVNLFAKSIK